MQKRTFFLIYLFFISVVTAQDKEASYSMSSFEDTNSIHTIASIVQEKFTPRPKKRISYGLTKSTVWLKFNLNTKQLSPEAILYIRNSFCDVLSLYYYDENNTIVEQSQGILVPNSKKKINHYLPSFLIPAKKISSPIVYLKVKSRWPLQVNVFIKTKEAFHNNRVNDYLIGGLLIGGALLLGIYNLFLFFSVRDFSYVLYVGALFGTTISQGYLFGILTPYIFPSSQNLPFNFLIFSSAITSILSIWFTIRFLDVKKTSTILYKILFFAALLPILNICIELFGYYELSRILYIIFLYTTCSVILTAGIYSYIKGNEIALYFSIAWFFYIIGLLIYILNLSGILPYNIFTTYSMPTGTLLEVTLISFALGYKYNLIQKEKEELENQTREELEALVTIQTHKLETTLKEKDILLQEIHHRVKNNLQLVISLLDIRLASVKGAENKKILDESKARIHSMSLIHQRLYQNDNLDYVDIKSYLEELFIYIKNSYTNSSLNIVSTQSIDQVNIPLSKAVPLGLIVNELLTNSFKYGVNSENETNIINIHSKINNDVLELYIVDSGKGFEENLNDLNVKKSMGLFLIKSLTKQLKGKIERYFEKELFVTKISIPMPKL